MGRKQAAADARRDAKADKRAGGPGKGASGKPASQRSNKGTKTYDKEYKAHTPKSWW